MGEKTNHDDENQTIIFFQINDYDAMRLSIHTVCMLCLCLCLCLEISSEREEGAKAPI